MNQNPFERAIMHVMRDMTSEQLAKRVPDIPAMDYRRLTYCLIEDRIAAYKAAGIKRTLDNVLTEFGITKKAYYSWYEKYHFFYKQCKNS
ncbi:MAG: hypothetical protein IJ920_04340 [Paludibacteraceae bacterium]|nr:hypothetical protein [Paludibacteraceae bacterium]